MSDPALSGESVGIVGAGIGGLAAAAHLADAGADVTIYEKQPQVGGVAGVIEEDGFRFDTGPSWYLMPGLFERFFEQFGYQPEELYDLVRLDPHYRIFWTDGDSVDIPANTDRAVELFESYEDGAGEAFEAYLEESAETYEIGMERFVVPNRSRFRDYLSADVAKSARGLSLLGTMDDHVAEYFDNPKLRQIVQYTLVFLGGAPHNTPALYNLMSHVDFELGVYYPQGGMYAVVEAMESVCEELGVEINTSTRVMGLEPVESGVAVAHDGDTRAHDRVVCNAPIAHAERKLLPDHAVDRDPEYWEHRTYAPSAYMCYLGVDGPLESLEHHTLVLPTDWDDHFHSIFEAPGWPDDPAYYVNVPSRTDPTAAPEGKETVVVLVPIAPDLDDDEAARERMRADVLDSLAEHAGVDLRGRIEFEREMCVSDYREQFNKPQGTALGLAHTLFQTGPMRPSHRAPGVDRLYYVGGDANPGIGVPMCLLSGEHVTETIIEDATGSGFVDSVLPEQLRP
ncbi:phytoene desaturase [Halovenus sp. WSH3]|uniref:Phytoene desaturase n=1 Tax=Halovenus carboxidivorans TaxID=2692199 RepID=A0A6B0TFJ5_9EURY|nr:phytoene desaturase family protein [Halovenus carboxidivorans]MXR51959.1 phytoene desaturase [Halovenus carboxidivorans]